MNISFEQALSGIQAAWHDLDSKAKHDTPDAFDATVEHAIAANDGQVVAPHALPSLIAALHRDGWDILTNEDHPDWADAASKNGSTIDSIQGLTNHCDRRILLKSKMPVARAFRTAVHETGHAWGKISIGAQVCKHSKATDADRRARAFDILVAQALGGLPLHIIEAEAEAELTALIVSDAMGLGLTPSFYYLAIYRQRTYLSVETFDNEILPRAWASASETAARILSIIAGAEKQRESQVA